MFFDQKWLWEPVETTVCPRESCTIIYNISETKHTKGFAILFRVAPWLNPQNWLTGKSGWLRSGRNAWFPLSYDYPCPINNPPLVNQCTQYTYSMSAVWLLCRTLITLNLIFILGTCNDHLPYYIVNKILNWLE